MATRVTQRIHRDATPKGVKPFMAAVTLQRANCEVGGVCGGLPASDTPLITTRQRGWCGVFAVRLMRDLPPDLTVG